MDSETVFISLTWATGCLVRNAAVRGRSWHADFLAAAHQICVKLVSHRHRITEPNSMTTPESKLEEHLNEKLPGLKYEYCRLTLVSTERKSCLKY
jgi:hypothetical protein